MKQIIHFTHWRLCSVKIVPALCIGFFVSPTVEKAYCMAVSSQ